MRTINIQKLDDFATLKLLHLVTDNCIGGTTYMAVPPVQRREKGQSEDNIKTQYGLGALNFQRHRKVKQLDARS
jgi:hypothetical protein